ncbi:MAG: hypothetical protein CMF74_09090 [Maricaulis sp.]|jgi:EAL domain-containing protein (putative c-di-GMP-specific phosphodiesterase class I)|nr:hypothetical protein [Maricaulis sp.]
MKPDDYAAGLDAAHAAVFRADFETVTLAGDVGRFGLTEAEYDLTTFFERIAPSDREAVQSGFFDDAIDVRARLIGEDGGVRYVRLIGRRGANGAFCGLMLPAGAVNSGAMGRIEAENSLTHGVGRGEVVAHYQPIVALETGRIAGFEALARWVCPGRGIIGPDDFLDLAEELDLTGAIGDQVRGLATRDLAAWRTAAPDAPLFVSANATVSELVSPGFAERLAGAVEAAGLRAGGFKLEINETEIMRDPDRAEGVIRELKSAGIGMALDDFGTGYSSLARLDRFNFDTVKIDRYFVRALAAGEHAAKVVESVLQLSRHFGMTVVAEGVESAEVAERLTEMGCDYAQGFRYSGAMEPDTAADAALNGLKGRFLRAVWT